MASNLSSSTVAVGVAVAATAAYVVYTLVSRSVARQDGDSGGDGALGGSSNFPKENEIIVDPTSGERYRLGRVLGRGSKGTVFLATSESDGTEWALKRTLLAALKPTERVMMEGEESVLRLLSPHPRINNLKSAFFFPSEKGTGKEAAPTDHVFILELIKGGELFDRVVKRSSYSEAVAQEAVRHILEGVAYCHAKGVVHRDLKPENICLADDTSDDNIQLIDFGFAKRLKAGEFDGSTYCGTVGYMPPEVACKKEGWSFAGDIWAVGCVAFILLYGTFPFDSDTDPTNFDLNLDDTGLEPLSSDVKDFLTFLFTRDPHKRPSAAQALQHRWLTGTASTAHRDRAREALKKFNARRKLRAGMLAIRTIRRMSKPFTHFGDGGDDGKRGAVGDNATEGGQPRRRSGRLMRGEKK